EQVAEVAATVGALLEEAGSGPTGVADLRCYLHRAEDPAVLADLLTLHMPGVTASTTELVDGFSAPGKRVELEITALRTAPCPDVRPTHRPPRGWRGPRRPGSGLVPAVPRVHVGVVGVVGIDRRGAGGRRARVPRGVSGAL